MDMKIKNSHGKSFFVVVFDYLLLMVHVSSIGSERSEGKRHKTSSW